MATLTGRLISSYKAPLRLKGSLISSYTSKHNVAKRFISIYATGPGSVRLISSYRSAKTYSGRFLASFNTLGPATVLSYPGGPLITQWEAAITQPGGDISAQFLVGNKALGDIPYAFTTNLNLSSPSTASLEILDPFYKYVPEAPGEWHDLMDEQPLNASYQTPKELKANITWGGRTFNYKFIGRSWNTSNNWLDRRQSFTWGLSDHSLKWQSDYESQITVRSTRQTVVTNADSLRELASLYNVKIDLKGLSYTHPIPVQHRQSGRPLDWVNDLVNETLQDDWVFVNGDTFTPFYPDPKHPKVVVDFSKHALEEESSGEWADIYNWVVLTRAVETGGKGSQIKVVEVDAYGQYTVVFDEPVFAPQWAIESAAQGVFSDFLYKDEKGRVTQVRGALAPSSIAYGTTFANGGPAAGVKSITFSWGIPSILSGLTGAYGRIVFRGTPYPDPDLWNGALFARQGGTVADPVPSLRSEAKDIESIAKYGVRRLELSANPQIPTKELADIIVQRILKKVSRRSRSGSVKIYLNPEITPGLVITEKIIPGFERVRIITSVEHRFSNDPADRYTRYQGLTYRGTL